MPEETSSSIARVMAASTAIFMFRIGFISSSFAVGDHPIQIVRVIKQNVGSAVVVVNALFVEKGLVRNFQPQDTVNRIVATLLIGIP